MSPEKTPNLDISEIESGNTAFNIYNEYVSIYLPFPTNLTSSLSPQWEGSDSSLQQVVGRELMTKGFSSTGDLIKDWAGQTKNALIQKSQSDVGLAASVAGAVIGGYDRVLHNEGKLINPHREMMFGGIDYRTHTFEFSIVLTNDTESKKFTQIVKNLQKYSSPDFLGGPRKALFMTYPEIWEIELYPTEEYLPSYLPCAITDISVDYAGEAGKIVFKEGYAPVSVNLTITVSERELLTRELIDKGWYG